MGKATGDHLNFFASCALLPGDQVEILLHHKLKTLNSLFDKRLCVLQSHTNWTSCGQANSSRASCGGHTFVDKNVWKEKKSELKNWKREKNEKERRWKWTNLWSVGVLDSSLRDQNVVQWILGDLNKNDRTDHAKGDWSVVRLLFFCIHQR